MNRVPVRPNMIQWALERAGLDVYQLEHSMPNCQPGNAERKNQP